MRREAALTSAVRPSAKHRKTRPPSPRPPPSPRGASPARPRPSNRLSEPGAAGGEAGEPVVATDAPRPPAGGAGVLSRGGGGGLGVAVVPGLPPGA